jgi:hypothetical protein
MLKRTFLFIGIMLLIALFAIPAGILFALTIPLFLVSIFPLVAIGFLYLNSRIGGVSSFFDDELDAKSSVSYAPHEPSFNQVVFQRHTFVIRRYELN